MIRKCLECLFGKQDEKQKKYETQDQKKKRYIIQYMAEKYLAQQTTNNSFPLNNGNYFQPNHTDVNFNSNNQSYFNPYEVQQPRVQKTYQEIIAQQNARSQEFIDQLRFEGVKVDDYFAYNRLFFQCGACSIPFNQRQKPNLRNCGHMVCNNSKCYLFQCVVPGCKQKSGLKIIGYWPWQDKQTTSYDKAQYDFIISYGNITDNQDVIKRFDGNRTFGQLMNSCPFAKRYLSTIPQHLQALTIKVSQIPYQQIKNKTINSQATKLFLTRSTSLGNSKNVILCINKQLGGNQW